MSQPLNVSLAGLDVAPEGTVVVLVGPKLALGEAGIALDKASKGHLKRAAKAVEFRAGFGTVCEVLAPEKLDQVTRVLMVGVGEADGKDDGSVEDPLNRWVRLGGRIGAELKRRKVKAATVLADTKPGALSADEVAHLALGLQMRSYQFDAFKTSAARGASGDDESDGGSGAGAAEDARQVTIACEDHSKADKELARAMAIAAGVDVARDLVNSPANALGPIEFAAEAAKLEALGVDIEEFDDAALERIGMHALLGVGQGSARPSRVVVMKWNGSRKKSAKPAVLVGKGVVFDTGGISLKPAKGMEDMKGDMGGAAAVVGAMHAIAARKAKANVIGIIGLVENMPGANAQRPGDIVTSLSGQTIEVINTDAEGRLVLGDLLWYAEDQFEPKIMINLATLTGAILVALGKEYAGLFSNDDDLVNQLTAAGLATGEKVWRMPMGPAYDKQIDSKFADMKNVGNGPYGGSITAAQFLQRFVRNTPWAHLDVAGTAMAAPQTDTNDSWGSGYGVRLLDRLVADAFEG